MRLTAIAPPLILKAMRPFFLLFVLYVFVIHWPIFANAQISFDEDTQRIMVLSLDDGTVLTDTLEAYPYLNEWYLPMTSLFEALDFAIIVSPTLGQAEGFFTSEKNLFELNRQTCEVKIKNVRKSYPCEGIISFEDELYVRHSLLKNWMGLEFTFNSYASEILVRSDEPLPEQAKRERQRLSQGEVPSTKDSLPENFGEHRLSDVGLGHFSFDQQLLYGVDRFSGNEKTRLRHDTSLGVELQGLETRAYVGGEGDSISESLLSISKKDPHGGLLGDLRAKSIEAMDLVLPAVPLIHPSVSARGLLISSFPLNQPNTFASREFQGPLPAGWEVELYQNDTLIGRKRADSGVEYRFKDVSLFFGINRFRLVFYGPQGQRREQVEVVNIGQQSTTPGESFYRFGWAQKKEDHRGQIISSQYRLGLNPSFSSGISYIGEQIGESHEPYNYLAADIAASFSRFYGALNIAQNDKSGTAGEVLVQVPFEKIILGGSYAELSNFKSNLYRLQDSQLIKSISKLSFQSSLFPILPIRLDGEIEERTYLNKNKIQSIKQRTALQLGSNYLFNTINQEIGDSSFLSGEALLLIPLNLNEARVWAEYRKKMDSIGASILTRWTDRFFTEVSARRNELADTSSLGLSANQRHQAFTWGSEVGFDDKGGFTALALFSYSLTQNPRRLDIVPSSQPQTLYGAASVRVFLDKNYSGDFDDGDQALPDIGLQVNNNDVTAKTDENGEAVLLQLPVHQPTDIGISYKTLADPQYYPKYQGGRIYPRPGQVAQIDLPVFVYSEIDGSVVMDTPQGRRGVRGLTVTLKDSTGKIIRQVRTEFDGFFLLDRLLPGDYLVELNSDELNKKKIHVNKTISQITISKDKPTDASLEIKALKGTKVRN